MRILRWMLLVFLAVTPLDGSQPEPSDHPDCEIVRGVIEDSIGWALTKDFDRLFQIFANDDDLLVWWVGTSGSAEGIGDLKRLAETVWKSPDFEATSFELRDLKISCSDDGRTAWFSGHLDDCGKWKGQEFCADNVRTSGVLEKRGNQWTIVQYHGSWPVDKIPDETWELLVKERNKSHRENSPSHIEE